MPADDFFNALILVQNWGNSVELEKIMNNNKHIISLYHMMGEASYLLDTNFDDKNQLSEFINHLKGYKLEGNVPAVIKLQTQKIIDIHKQKSNFTLRDYINDKRHFHFFTYVDNTGSDDEVINFASENENIYSVLHIQGPHSFVMEIMTSDYNSYKTILSKMKQLKSVKQIITQEVIKVIKYRNQAIDEMGSLIYPLNDIREMFTI